MWTPLRRNLELVVGEPFDRQFQIWKDDESTDPFDISLCIVTFTLAGDVFGVPSGAVALTPASDGSSGDVVNQINVFLNAAQTSAYEGRARARWKLDVEPYGVPVHGHCYMVRS